MLLQVLAALATELPAVNGGQESWSRVAVHRALVPGAPDVVARVWSGAGPDVYFQVEGHAPSMVNVVTQDQQDEPCIAALPGAPDGAAFDLAYDNRFPYMHVEHRRYDLQGTALALPERIDEQATAWRPLVSVRADGLVAFAYTGTFSNRGFIRLLNPDGSWLTPSIEVGTHANEEDPAICWLPSGDLFVVWCDFQAGSGLGVELSSRIYVPSLDAFAGTASRVVQAGLLGDQRWPVCALGPDGTPWVAFEDLAGVWLMQGMSKPPVLIGSGHLPCLAPPFIAFERGGDIWAQNAIGSDPAQRLNRWTVGAQHRPGLALASNGVLWGAWDGPSWSNTTNDVFVRAFFCQ